MMGNNEGDRFLDLYFVEDFAERVYNHIISRVRDSGLCIIALTFNEDSVLSADYIATLVKGMLKSHAHITLVRPESSEARMESCKLYNLDKLYSNLSYL